MIPWYPFLSVVAALVVIVVELAWARTGIFRMPAYWLAMAVVFAFMIPVDGWMSKTTDPIIIYNPEELSGLRFPWDIPTEEFAYAWALITLAIVLWERAGQRDRASRPEGAGTTGRMRRS